MKKDSIIHFVGFTTRLESDKFIYQWTRYAQQIPSVPGVVLQAQTKGKSRYHYVSQHECQEEDFRFSFMKGRESESFPEQSAKVVMLGGYSPVMIGQDHWDRKWDTKVLMFFTGNILSSHFYYDMVQNVRPNIYQPFYENCLYTNIIEFAAVEKDALILADWLTKKSEDADISIYTRCATPDLVV
jgi:hypothetical protein